MRAVVQRVRSARVEVEGQTTGAIGRGLVVLLGVASGDGDEEVSYLANKVLHLRVFPDERLPMNRSLMDVGGEILLVSQFTLYGDCRKGRRPSFDRAEAPAGAELLYRRFADFLTRAGHTPQEGVFGASMVVSLENDGPVTLLIDSEKEF
jgi:D-tyrosyl-tRNA(Tyr) deacylase